MGVSGQGYRVLAGGKLGRRPRLATVQLELAGDKELGECLRDLLELLFHHGSPGERLGQLMERPPRS
jgi:dissimilatory sulfite reductase (desulfoviridin) alpha/beta subunit